MANRKGGFIGQDGLNAPDEPTGVSGTAGNNSVEVNFTAPSNTGGAPVSTYLVTDSTKAHSATGSSSPITVTGLTNGTSYTFNVWAINGFGWSVASETSDSVTPVLSRAMIFGGYSIGTWYNTIEYITPETTGNSSDFGDLNTRVYKTASAGNTTRALTSCGSTTGGTRVNNIQYISPASGGTASDFGDATVVRDNLTMNCNDTRAVIAMNDTTPDLPIDYVTIATTGNAINFGNLTDGRGEGMNGNCNNTTRGCFVNGDRVNTIDYITFSTTGNAVNFGDMANTGILGGVLSGGSSRAVVCGGSAASTAMYYFNITTTGNTSSFGTLSQTYEKNTATASKTRGIIWGDIGGSNHIDYITIATTGNSSDFGDLITFVHEQSGSTSTTHGGLA